MEEISYIALVLSIAALIFAIVDPSYLPSLTIDNLEVTNNLTKPLNYIHYAEGFFNSNFTDPFRIEIAAANTSYNFTGFSPSDYYGFTWYGSGVKVEKAGLYKLTGSISYKGGNNQEYAFLMSVNGARASDCVTGSTSTAVIDDVVITCLKRLEVGDSLNLQVIDRSTPATAVLIYRITLNIIEIPETI